ncbi:T9SS sorting signal type C domain-containing protein [Flavobacterium sp. FlaQc-50]|uniref:T9SS sorting signal type C domain-containing protein n=1 Tax=unclassified Flavobacterium TaxID=196869 RepID=UPI003757A7F3
MIKKLLLFVDFLFCQKINKPKSYKVFGLLQFLFLLFFTGIGNAQVANYSFAQATGTYASITGTTIFPSPWDENVSTNILLGFTFKYNGINYTECSVNTNGFLTFSPSASPIYSNTNEYSPISSTTGYSGAISALGRDLISNGSSIIYNTIGTAPNRIFVVQWTNARRYYSGNSRNGDFNFQIRLNETTNEVQIVYGACTSSYNTDLTVQVGLRGASNADFNNRTTSNNWPASTAGGVNSSTCNTGNGSGELPTNGLTYTWTPSVCSFTNFTTVRQITNVKLNTIDNNSTGTTSYESFTGVNTTLVKGQNYTVSVKGVTASNSNIFYTAYIDWNQDNDFTDTGEKFNIGSINNSNGADGKIASVYFQIPTDATVGSTRMRIIGQSTDYVTNPCTTTVTSPEGQVEDYTIIVGDVCSGTPAASTTLSTATTVCPGTPFTLSLGTTYSDGATYVWQTSPNGVDTWTNATPTPTTFFGTEAFSSLPANTSISGNASITGGQLVLTPAATSQKGGFLVDKSPGSNINAFTTSFDYTAGGGGGADGFSLSYAGALTNTDSGGELGEGSGIIVQFDTYDNEGVANGSRIRILYNGTGVFTSALDVPFNIRTTTARNVVLSVDNKGYLSLTMVNSSGTIITVVSNFLLPAAYLSTDKSAWKFKFSARTGAITDIHTIDNLLIRYLDVTNSKSTFTTTQTVKTFYRAKITCTASTTDSTPVAVDVISATITPMTASVCSGSQFTATPTTGTNGTIPSGTTFTWTTPTIAVSGAITGGTASTGTPNGNIIGTLTNTTTTPQTATYTVTPTTSGCVGVPFTLTVTVNPRPIVSYTAQPGTSTCIGTNVTYTTQPSMTNYIWGFPGVAGTDYTIVSGGTNASNTVTLKYLTTGSKTVTINYTNANSCTATTATSSTATTVNALPIVTFTAQPGASACVGTNVIYTTEATMSNYVWVFPGTAGTDYTIVSGGASTNNTVTLRYLTTGSKTVTVNYTNTNSCTATTATSSTATTVNALPIVTFTAQPGASACVGTNVTYTTEATMTNYVWVFPGTAGTDYTIVSGGTNTSNTVTLRYLTTGSKTVTVNYTNTNSCTATTATSSTATTVNARPIITFTAQPGVSTCVGTNVTYTTEATMSSYVWVFPGTAGTDYTIVSGGASTNNTVTLRYLTTGSKTVTVNYTNTNSCTATTATSSTATTVNALPIVTFTAQPGASTCVGTNVTYTTEATMSNYVWVFPGTAGTDYTIVSGGTNTNNTVTLRYLTTGSKTVTVNYTNTNSCTATTATSSTATTVNARPIVTFTAQPGLSTCVGTNVTYTTEATMSSYVWVFPGTAGTDYTIVSGGTSTNNTVTLRYLTTGSKTVTVNYTNTNSCTATTATSSTATTVNARPIVTFTAQPGVSTCVGTNVTYTTEATMTNYVWVFPGTAGTDYTIVSGGTSTNNTVTLRYLTTGSKTVTVNYTNTNSCTATTATSSTATTVNALPIVTFTAQPGASACVGTNVTYTTEAGMSNYVWVFPGIAGTDYTIVSGGANTNNTVTLRYLTTGSKTVTINYTDTNSCIATSATSSTATTVNAGPTAPIVGTITHPTCIIATGSVQLSGLPATGTWTLTRTPGAVQTTGSGATTSITGLAANTTYTYTVSSGACPSVSSVNVVINPIPQLATWNAGWTNGPPTINQPVLFEGDYTSTADVNACSCTIGLTAKVVISIGNTLKITNGLTVANTASLTFENNSSLVQTNDDPTINSGIITYKRKTSLRLTDYGYWSTPVNPKKLVDVSPLTLSDKYMGFNGTGWVITNSNTEMIIGKGYIIRGPQTFSNVDRADFTAEFKGTPNNGALNGETVEADKFYLIGNPYASALNANSFLDDNPFMNGTLYFWTHNTPIGGSNGLKYLADDYAAFNLTGGVNTKAPTGDDAPGNNDSEPSGYIAAGQSFFASAASPGTVSFKNYMREGGANNGQFFKPARPSKEKASRNRIWINIINKEGIFKQTLLGYVNGATNSYENRYDGESFDGNPALDFYSINNDRNLVIQGRALPFTDTDIVPLGYRSAAAGDYTISIGKIEGDLINQNIFIEDKTTGKIHNLKTAKYTFTTAKGTFADRFVLRYTDKTLGTGDFENTENNVFVTAINKVIKVISAKETIKEVTIYDVSGKLLYNKKKIGETELQIANLQSANQVLLIKVILDNNHTTTKKVIFQ